MEIKWKLWHSPTISARACRRSRPRKALAPAPALQPEPAGAGDGARPGPGAGGPGGPRGRPAVPGGCRSGAARRCLPRDRTSEPSRSAPLSAAAALPARGEAGGRGRKVTAGCAMILITAITARLFSGGTEPCAASPGKPEERRTGAAFPPASSPARRRGEPRLRHGSARLGRAPRQPVAGPRAQPGGARPGSVRPRRLGRAGLLSAGVRARTERAR